MNVGHGPHTYTDAPAQAFTATGNTKITTLDLGTVAKLDFGLFSGNTLLANINAPAITTPLLANAAVDIRLLTGNAITASMTAEIVGTRNIEITDTGAYTTFSSWKTYIDQYLQVPTGGAALLDLVLVGVVPTSGKIRISLDWQGMSNARATGVADSTNATFALACAGGAVVAGPPSYNAGLGLTVAGIVNAGTIDSLAELAHIDSVTHNNFTVLL